VSARLVENLAKRESNMLQTRKQAFVLLLGKSRQKEALLGRIMKFFAVSGLTCPGSAGNGVKPYFVKYKRQRDALTCTAAAVGTK